MDSIEESVVIRQIKVSSSLQFFKPDILKKFSLLDYHNNEAPAFFWGCYNFDDIKIIMNHRGPKVLIWAGSDSMKSDSLQLIKRLPSLFHIATSKFIEKDLKAQGINYTSLSLCPVELSDWPFASQRKGNALYVYTSKWKPAFYGKHLYEEVQRLLPKMEFFICDAHSFERQDLLSIYQKCFIGLRLCPHDGLSATVMELGLLGIKTVHNGELPGSLAYKSVDDIMAHIHHESKTIETPNQDLAEQTARFLALPDNWNQISLYNSQQNPL